MKKKFFVVAAVCISSSTQAQQDTTVAALNEVIVTANRIEQKQTQTGKVVTVIGKDILNRSQGRSIAQVLNEQAGITINGALNNAGTVQTVYLRGSNSGRVLILLDGIPVSDPSQINNEFDLNLIPIHEVERIEIARGAQSTLYGSDAVAGVINIITVKENIRKPFQVKAGLSAGNNRTLRQHIQLYGKQGALQYQIRGSRLSTKGFSSAQDESNLQQFDRDGFRGQTLSASIRYQATKHFSLRTFLQNNRYNNDVDNGMFTDDRDFTQQSRNLNTGAGFTWKGEGVQVSGNYQYSKGRRNFLDDSTHVGGFAKFVQDDYASKSHFMELFASFQLNKQLVLLTGYDNRIISYNNSYHSISDWGPYKSLFKDTSLRLESLYASVVYNSKNQKFNLEAGGRFNVNSRYGNNTTFTLNPSYALSNRVRLFGSIATGFKSPSLYQLYSAFAGNLDLKPEKSINYEAGVQHNAKKIRSRAVFFYREIKTGIDYNYVTFGYYNIPNQIVRGLELELHVMPVQNLQLSANYTYLSGNEFLQSRITTKDTAYSYLLRRPKHHLNVQVGYTFTNGLYVSFQVKSVSQRYDVGGYQVADVRLKPYVIAGAYASYTWNKKMKLFADAQNLTNTRFYDIRGFNSIPFLIQGGIQIEL
jgi:vitamin B12 transporter